MSACAHRRLSPAYHQSLDLLLAAVVWIKRACPEATPAQIEEAAGQVAWEVAKVNKISRAIFRRALAARATLNRIAGVG